MTRISEQMLFTSLQDNIRRNQVAQFEAQGRAQTGVRVQRASDDPVAAAQGSIMASALERLAGMTRAADRGEFALKHSETALAGAADQIKRVQELAIAGASDQFNQDDKQVMADEVARITESVLALANTQVDGVYLFAGMATGTQPFLPTGVFVGDANDRMVEVAPGVRVAINASGSEAFTAAGGIDLFTVLTDLENALAINDTAAVNAQIDLLNAAHDQLVLERSEVGVQLQALERAATVRQDSVLDLEAGRSDTLGVDPAEAYVDLLAAQTGLESALAQAQRILQALLQGPRL